MVVGGVICVHFRAASSVAACRRGPSFPSFTSVVIFFGFNIQDRWSIKEARKSPTMALGPVPDSLKIASMTEISVLVVSSPQKADQSGVLWRDGVGTTERTHKPRATTGDGPTDGRMRAVVPACKRTVYDHASAQHVAPSVTSSRHHRDLQQRR